MVAVVEVHWIDQREPKMITLYNWGMSRSSKTKITRDSILNTALDLAAEKGWDALAMADLAADLKISSAELQHYFVDKNAIADAWFARALEAMLQPLPQDLEDNRERLETLMNRWLDALASHRAVTADMLSDKMWPFHPHHWVPMIFDLSRLVQWWRDAAGMRAGGRRRQVEEIALTGVFLGTLKRWCRDESAGQADSKAYLAKRLSLPIFN